MQLAVLQIMVFNRYSSLFNVAYAKVVHSSHIFFILYGITNLPNKNKQTIKGITIAGCELKNTCYADYASFILDGSKRSFETLIDILENFSFISRLKLYPKMSSFTNRYYKRFKYSIPGKKFNVALMKPKLSGWYFPQKKNGI